MNNNEIIKLALAKSELTEKDISARTMKILIDALNILRYKNQQVIENPVHEPFPALFRDFMMACIQNIGHVGKPFDNYRFRVNQEPNTNWKQFRFDKKQIRKHFIKCNPEMADVSAIRFVVWMVLFGKGYNLTPRQWRSNGSGYLQFDKG